MLHVALPQLSSMQQIGNERRPFFHFFERRRRMEQKKYYNTQRALERERAEVTSLEAQALWWFICNNLLWDAAKSSLREAAEIFQDGSTCLGLGQSIDTRNESQKSIHKKVIFPWMELTYNATTLETWHLCLLLWKFRRFPALQIQRTFVYYFIIALTSAFN